MITLLLLVVVFGVKITLSTVVTGLLGLWEVAGRIIPNKTENPPTVVGLVIGFLNFLNNTLNVKK